MIGEVSDPALAGRDGELAELLSMLEDAQAGRPGVALVEGASGMGRTALLDRLARHGQAQGMTVLRAQGSVLEREFTLGLARQLFRTASAANRVDEPLSPAGLFGVFDELFQQSVRIAERAPVLIAVDDFHHADPQSAQWIDFLARRLIDIPMLVLLSSDRDAASGHQALTAELALHSVCRVIEPAPLPVSAVAGLTATMLGSPADVDFVRECHALSGGNPKLLLLMLREFARSGITPTTEDLPRAADAALHTMVSTLLKWLARYPADVSRVAGMFALLGDDTDPDLLRRLTGLSIRKITSSLTVLERIGLLRDDRSRRFVHPLVRDAITADLSIAERSAIHARAAHVLFADGEPHERVAAHIMASEATGEQWQTDVLRAAARQASARGSVETAVSCLRRAVQTAGSQHERAALLIELGAIEANFGITSSVRHLTEGVELTEDLAERTRGVPLLAEGLVGCGQARRAVDLLDRLAAEIPPGDTESLHRVLGQRAVSALAAGAASQAPSPTDPPHTNEVFGRRSLPAVSGATPGERMLLASSALHASMTLTGADRAAGSAEQALRTFDPDKEQIWAATLAISVLRHADRLESAHHWANAVIASRLDGHPPATRAVLHAEIAHVRYRTGDLPGAVRESGEALALLPGPHPYGPFVAAAAIVPLVESGRLEEASRIADDNRFRYASEHWLRPYYLAARGQLRAAGGQNRAALHDLEECGRMLAKYGGDNPGRIPWRSQAAVLHQQHQRYDEAHRLATEELVLARKWGAPLTLARSLRAAATTGPAAATIGPGAGSAGLLEESVALLNGSSGRLELVRSLIAQGNALHETGRTEAARETLRRALGFAQEASARRSAEEAYQRLVATGARPRRFSQVGPRALTAGQRRVAELAAQGLSNEEIAGRLYVAQRTVEFHLTHVYRKLGISCRTDLTRTLGTEAAA
ncbi:AAA family ATPase [Streptomyces sp. NPDC006704]|uniref:AAA family ATPase n=1 Tax=Streptomyces sp. NPDC006704 TaxID=3364760 RepID=UPI0036B5C100